MWTRINSDDPERLKTASSKSRTNIHRYATKYHKNGMKRGKKPYLNAALNLYNLYLKNFSESKESYELRYYLADIHYYFKNFDRAADEYYTVSQVKGKFQRNRLNQQLHR